MPGEGRMREKLGLDLDASGARRKTAAEHEPCTWRVSCACPRAVWCARGCMYDASCWTA
jgi:hypothetical protein